MVKITYANGDQINGNYSFCDNYDEALAIYNADAEHGARVEFDNRSDNEGKEDWELEDFLAESREFHYIAKITTTITTDENGDEETEEWSEVIT